MASTIEIVDMLDATGVDLARIPRGTRRVAIYLTGSGGIAATDADVRELVRRVPGIQTFLRIDQSNGQALDGLPVYLVKDIESGASTVATAVEQARVRAARGLKTGMYFSRADWDAVAGAVDAAGLREDVGFWVADWNLDREGAIGFLETDSRIKAVQYQSDEYFDRSVTRADWPAPLPPHRHRRPRPPKVHPKVRAAGIAGALTTALLAYLNARGVHVTHLSTGEASAITLVASVLAGYFQPAEKP